MDGNNNAIHMVANPHNGLELHSSNRNNLSRLELYKKLYNKVISVGEYKN